MKFKPILLLLLLKSVQSLASGVDTLKLYYPIDKYELSAENKAKLEGLNKLLADSAAISVTGYADYLGTSNHNIILSRNRAETVKAYLLTLKETFAVSTGGMGAVKSSTEKSVMGEPSNRRVDVIYEVKKPLAMTKPIPVRAPVVPVTKRDSVPARPKQAITVDTTREPASFNARLNNLKDAKVGSSISFEELTFQPGRHFLNPEAVRYLITILKFMQKHTNVTFQIIGHICCEIDGRDGEDYDSGGYVLSVNRAKFIYDYFIEKGIAANRMTYKGVGSTRQKVFPERTERDRYLNRRVEFLITGK
ncbi:OmpA family protein [Mucilaginibacter sp. L3T2-6]|uniref:OmpA family protein n=1 Tax=Mucilaginibacter sp. L3T2-6 TaxID=3062491 RepID=UPI002675288F|nr:OmpA family protein [Mucilaginibacter sp. L3T2-6]MDO3643831.1 OmpA family protein [Mucilaginibacter sp. L3T2-6]MDV6216282.1 OmpA family protein [Mucilaginibacter sp. L3T2-6]